MLDRFVFRRDDGVKPLPENWTTAASSTCIGVGFFFSLGLIPPPSISRFYLEWPGGPKQESDILCHLVATHRDCILFRLASIVTSNTHPQHLIFLDDYYIYRPATANLERLPTCIRMNPDAAEEREQKHDKLDLISESELSKSEWEWGEIVVTEEMKWMEKVAREDYKEKLAIGVDVDQEVVCSHVSSSLVIERIGLLCLERSEGGDEFVVAELSLNKRSRKVSAELSLLGSRVCDWVHLPLPIHCNNKHDSAALRCFWV